MPEARGWTILLVFFLIVLVFLLAPVIFATGTGWEAVSTGVYTVYNANVFGVALDMTNGFGYLAKANMWFLNGAPTSGATGTGHVIAFPATMIYPAVTLDDTTVVFKLVTGAGALTFSPPSGYSAWN